MRGTWRPVRCGLTLITALACVALPAGLGAAGPAAGSVVGARGTAVGGARLWLSLYSGPGSSGCSAAGSAVVGPGGGTVYVTGGSMSGDFPSDYDYATVAYSAATGRPRWASRYRGPGNGDDIAAAAAISPDGATVFVTGSSLGTTSGNDYATVAYNAATGAQLWASRYNGPGNGDDHAVAVAVSPDGGTVFVTGSSTGARSGHDYATVAYDAATGAQLWVRRYSGPGNSYDEARAVAVSPGGGTVFMTGGSNRTGTATGRDFVTIAYNARTGARQWLSRYNGPANQGDTAHGLAVAPDGHEVFVTGPSHGRRSGVDYATVAYNAATGAQLWARRYNGPGNSTDEPESVAVSPGGRQVYVTGHSQGARSRQDYATVAYGATTGRPLWVSRYNGPANLDDFASSVAPGPGGREVFVTGFSDGATSGTDYATVAYRAADGARLWAARYNGTGNNQDFATSVATGPRGAVFVTGGSDSGQCYNYATIAYKG
jgi:PQQ-like domain